tara:strand:+ start:319 stop:939 length:621 start_codon:yes stop_codon:yes gene_type:complete
MSGKGNAGLNNKREGSAKQNYTAIKYGNNQGSIAFGQIHKQGDVTSSVMLETPDGEHQLSLDLDGERTGWTVSTSPGNFQVECGSANKEAEDSLVLNAKNGNILITATNGKIRMQATDIELVAVGEGGAKGNIKMNATESIVTESKKLLMTAKSFYRIASPQTGEVVANGVLKLYGSIIRGVTDAVAVKDSKVGGQRFQKQMNEGV